MPQATNLVIKNGAATPVDKTFTLVTPAAGDNSLAQWRLKEGLIVAQNPAISALTRPTNNRSRQVVLKVRLPSSFSDTALTGRVVMSSAFEFNGTVSVPDDFPEALKDDAVAYVSNLMGHALIKSMIRDTSPAT